MAIAASHSDPPVVAQQIKPVFVTGFFILAIESAPARHAPAHPENRAVVGKDGAQWRSRRGFQGRRRGSSWGSSLWVVVFSLSSLPCMLD